MAKRNYGYDDQVKADSGKKAKGKPPAPASPPKVKKGVKPVKPEPDYTQNAGEYDDDNPNPD